MKNEKTAVLNSILGYIEAMQINAKTSSEALESVSLIANFQDKLERFNNNSGVSGSFPFILGLGKPDEALSEADIDKFIAAAEEAGLGNLVVKREINGYVCGFFHHDALDFVSHYAENEGGYIKWMNLQTNGIVLHDIDFVGFYSAKIPDLLDFAEKVKKSIENLSA